MTFSATITRDNRVLVSWEGRQVVALTDAAASNVIDRLERAEDEEAEQMVLARATGNFKRGNKR